MSWALGTSGKMSFSPMKWQLFFTTFLLFSNSIFCFTFSSLKIQNNAEPNHLKNKRFPTVSQYFSNSSKFIITKQTALYSVVPGYTAEDKEELLEVFQELCDEDGLISFEDFLKYEEVASLIEEGELEVSEVEMIYQSVPKKDGKKIDADGFVKMNWQIDELFEFEEEEVPIPKEIEKAIEVESGDDEEETDVKDTEDGGLQYDETILKKEFNSIKGEDGLLAFSDFVEWQEIDDMLKEEDVMIAELEDMWKEVPKAAANSQKVEFDGFFAIMKQIEDLFYYEEEEDDLEEEMGQEETTKAVEELAQQTPSSPEAMPDLVATSKAAKLAALKAQQSGVVDPAIAKDELLDLIDPLVEDIGMDTPSKTKTKIVQCAKSLASAQDNLLKKLDQEALLEALTGNWQLIYTSSSSVGFNQGLTGLAKTLPGATYRETFMNLKKEGFLQELVYTEILDLGEDGEKTLEVTVDGDWDLLSKKSILTGEQVLSLVAYPKDIRYSFVKMKADKWKALRPANTLDLVYLDNNIRIMQVQSVPDTIFVFQKA